MRYTPPPNKLVYNNQVWELVRQIPQGKVATYGQITHLIPTPQGVSDEDYQTCAARWVGLAMAACPDDVPWHRVINSQGKISHSAQYGKQKQLLQSEGFLFLNEKLNLQEYQWCGPGGSNEPVQIRLF